MVLHTDNQFAAVSLFFNSVRYPLEVFRHKARITLAVLIVDKRKQHDIVRKLDNIRRGSEVGYVFLLRPVRSEVKIHFVQFLACDSLDIVIDLVAYIPPCVAVTAPIVGCKGNANGYFFGKFIKLFNHLEVARFFAVVGYIADYHKCVGIYPFNLFKCGVDYRSRFPQAFLICSASPFICLAACSECFGIVVRVGNKGKRCFITVLHLLSRELPFRGVP